MEIAIYAALGILGLWIMLAIYFTGAVRGYRLARQADAKYPFTKGYLRRFYSDEWPELTPPPDGAKVRELNGKKAHLQWCYDVLETTNYQTPDEIEEADKIKLQAEVLEREIAELERAL